MDKKIGSLVFNVAGYEITPEEREIVAHPLVGGVILFANNYDSRGQIKALCQALRLARKQPLLIMVDQEGGRVQRFKNEFTRLPPMGYWGEHYAADPVRACQLAQDCGWLMAAEILTAGIDMSLAPVLDLNKGMNSVIGNRAFHSDAETVVALASAFIQGMQEAGMSPTVKHFPGHGAVALDSHVALPVDGRELSDIQQDDMIPFARLIKAGIVAMMAAHIVFPRVDSLPVGFSKRWLQDILREQLGFRGTLFSDDLNMEGANISANYADRVVAAREAGCDFALLCNNRAGVIQVLDNLSYAAHQVSEHKWGALQGKYSRVEGPLQENKRWLKTQEFLQRITSLA